MMSPLDRHSSSREYQGEASADEQTTAARESSAGRTGKTMTGRSRTRYLHQRLHVVVGIALALIGIRFPRVDAFLLSTTTRGIGTRLYGARTAERSLRVGVGSVPGVSRRRVRGLIMALEGGMFISRYPAPVSKPYSWKDVPVVLSLC